MKSGTNICTVIAKLAALGIMFFRVQRTFTSAFLHKHRVYMQIFANKMT